MSISQKLSRLYWQSFFSARFSLSKEDAVKFLNSFWNIGNKGI